MLKPYLLYNLVRDMFLPTSCPVCSKLSEASGICTECINALETARLDEKSFYTLACEDGYGIKCGSVFSYEYDQVKSLEFYLKRNPDRATAMFCAKLLAGLLHGLGITGEIDVTYLPRSSEGLRENGFDQSRLTAECLAGILNDARFKTLVKRTGTSKTQKSLTAKERKENVKGKFRAVKTDASPKNIIIVDDVLTTGASIAQCALVLRQAFPTSEIYCVTVAKNMSTARL